jgi:hypothetical protein
MWLALLSWLVLLSFACGDDRRDARGHDSGHAAADRRIAANRRATQGTAPATSVTSAAADPRAGPTADPPAADPRADPTATDPAEITDRQFAELFRRLSEPDRGFFGENLVSNETSYLHVAGELEGRASGGAYLGVGPEQNLSYIALARPRLAFLVDIRRDNALLHLLYKALFELADSRAGFLALLLGREPVAGDTTGLSAAELIARVEAMPRDADRHRRDHRRAIDLLRGELALPLSADDRARLAALHRQFFDRQLDLRFAWHKDNGRDYPTLRELLLATDREGAARSFLSREDAFLAVRALQRENRIVPVVGDLAGDRALRRIAAELERRATPLAVFYVSNVEQYLLDSPAAWQGWLRNLARFPLADDALVVRSYLAGDRPHPAQRPGHRTTTLLAPIAELLAHRRCDSYWQLVTESPAAAPAEP